MEAPVLDVPRRRGGTAAAVLLGLLLVAAGTGIVMFLVPSYPPSTPYGFCHDINRPATWFGCASGQSPWLPYALFGVGAGGSWLILRRRR